MKHLFSIVLVLISYISNAQNLTKGILTYGVIKPYSPYYFDSLKLVSGAVEGMTGKDSIVVLMLNAFTIDRYSFPVKSYKSYNVKTRQIVFFDSSAVHNHSNAFFNTLSLNSDSIKSELDLIPKRFAEIERLKIQNDSLRIVNQAQKEIQNIKRQGLGILDWSVFSQEYSDFSGVYISYINTSKKTIKYIWVYVQAYNAVNDPVKPFYGTGLLGSGKGVGPIEPGDKGSYEFESIWYSNTLDHCKLKSIKVQYMDGSFKTFNSPNSITLSEETLEYINKLQ